MCTRIHFTHMTSRIPSTSYVIRRTAIWLFNMSTFLLWDRRAQSLLAGQSGDRIPVEARFSAPIQTGPGQGRIKLFRAPRQWKHFRPLFQAVFLSGVGGVLPPRLSQTPRLPVPRDRNNKYFILYIEFVAADLLFRLARMRHAWKGDCYLRVLVFSWQILFLLS